MTTKCHLQMYQITQDFAKVYLDLMAQAAQEAKLNSPWVIATFDTFLENLFDLQQARYKAEQK